MSRRSSRSRSAASASGSSSSARSHSVSWLSAPDTAIDELSCARGGRGHAVQRGAQRHEAGEMSEGCLRRPLEGGDGGLVPMELGDGRGARRRREGAQVPDAEAAVVGARGDEVVDDAAEARGGAAARAAAAAAAAAAAHRFHEMTLTSTACPSSTHSAAPFFRRASHTRSVESQPAERKTFGSTGDHSRSSTDAVCPT
ncbi:hypothetical protein AB1Y20_001473 [Prymnesium parvum]|uniref:Uncharacterized protein n=1 Tax=Prymnesium parvum TaxID=97485 RepID=A0AB34KAZ5_PRYPA